MDIINKQKRRTLWYDDDKKNIHPKIKKNHPKTSILLHFHFLPKKAREIGKVVLATNQHCVGENVQQYGFGRVASPHNIEEQAQQLVLLAQQLQDKRSSYDRYEEYYTNNSTQAFQAAIRIMLNV
ncbi:MAG: hypothetical protein U0T07_09000 [Chitinophagales bacterium]